jgi:hypothetical protein
MVQVAEFKDHHALGSLTGDGLDGASSHNDFDLVDFVRTESSRYKLLLVFFLVGDCRRRSRSTRNDPSLPGGPFVELSAANNRRGRRATIPAIVFVSAEIFDDEPWRPAASRLHPENGASLTAESFR